LTALTFTEALRSHPRYTEQGSFEAWLWTIARRKLQDATRRQHPTVPLEQLAAQLVDPGPSPEVQALQREQLGLLQDLLDELPQDQQAVVRLRYGGHWSFQDIATHLNRSVGAVKMLLQRALATLRARYRQQEQRQGEPATTARYAANDLPTWNVAFGLLRSTVSALVLGADRWRLALRPRPWPTLQPVRAVVPPHDRHVLRYLRA
jgi:RNA polymerase sigma factor (sigma-70 family)